MQLGDREKNSILISFIFNLTFIFIFVILGVSHTYSKYEEIEGFKFELKNTLDDTELIKKKGITFKDFNSLKAKVSYTKTEFLDTILKNLKPLFYSENFINKGDGTFENFLTNKERYFFANDELLAFEEEELETLDDDVEEKIRKEKTRKEKIFNILPSYNPSLKGVDENLLTDFKFVNYIESIIRTFELQTEAEIGIKSLVPYESKDNKKTKIKITSTNARIFYIPLSLELLGSKENIINFLHYVGNVGNIEIIDGDFNILQDDFLKKRRKIILTGDFNKLFGNGSRYKEGYEDLDSVSKYNIYNNQIIDIESVSMVEYPVAYYLEGTRDKKDNLVEFLKDKQKNHKFKINISLRFYVKGIPNYKMIEFIKSFILKYEDTKKKVTLKISDFSKNKEIKKDGDLILLKSQYEKANTYLNSIGPDVNKFQKSLVKAGAIDKLYENVLEYDKILENIISVLGVDDENIEEDILLEEVKK